jgi:hypothetical protein
MPMRYPRSLLRNGCVSTHPCAAAVGRAGHLCGSLLKGSEGLQHTRQTLLATERNICWAGCMLGRVSRWPVLACRAGGADPARLEVEPRDAAASQPATAG